jgi:phosphoribosylanthranilate isomerase
MFGIAAKNRIRVKICGITNEADAIAAIECGADALGFNLYPASPRYIDLAQARSWLEKLPREICKVAVMVNPDANRAKKTAKLPFIDFLQLHGQESPAFCETLAKDGISFAKAIPITDRRSIEKFPNFHTTWLVLDSASDGKFGGTGQVFSWSLARGIVDQHEEFKIILAGGLTPENVAEAIREVAPFGVDVASGVETSRGRKNHGRLKAFVQAVQSARS